MKIRYRTKKLEKVCTNANKAQEKWGKKQSEKIFQRLQELSIVDTVDELITYRFGRCHALTGDRKGQYAMDLIHPYRLIFSITDDTVQIADVETAMIEDITDYH